MSNKHSKFTPRELKLFDVARSVAETSLHHKARIGAVLAEHGIVASVGVNGVKSHPLQLKYNHIRFRDDAVSGMGHLMHAEIQAIVKRPRYFVADDAAIFVYRAMKDGATGLARPCKGCTQALLDFGVTRMYYTTEKGLVYEELK